MQFTMNRDALLHAAQIMAKVAAKASTQAMACTLIETSDGNASFSATDGEQAIVHTDIAMIMDDGACMVPAQALARVVKSLKDGAVIVTAESGAVSVECGKSRFELPSLTVDNWQGMPSDGEGPTCKVDAAVLQDMAKRVVPFAAEKKEAREWSKGVNIAFEGGSIKLQASDSYRIAECWHDAEGEEFAVLVPATFVTDAVAAMFGEVEITSDGNRCTFACANTRISTRAIATKFPNIKQMWPKAPKYALQLSMRELSGAFGRALQLGNNPVDLDATGGQMRVSVNESGIGKFEENIPCDGDYSGCAALQYIKTCVDAMDVDEVSVQSDGEIAPITFYGDKVRACVMPIRRSA